MKFQFIENAPKLLSVSDEITDYGRIYTTPEGFRYPSVTTFLRKVLDKSGLERWRKRVGDEKADQIVRRAGIRGTKIHDLSERFLKNKNPKEFLKGEMPTTIASFKNIQKILENNIQNIHFLEAPLYSTKMKLAGRVDCIAEWNGELAIIDFKTSLRLKREEWILGYKLQTTIYSMMYYELTGYRAKKAVIIIVNDEDLPQIFEINVGDYIPKTLELLKNFNFKEEI